MFSAVTAWTAVTLATVAAVAWEVSGSVRLTQLKKEFLKSLAPGRRGRNFKSMILQNSRLGGVHCGIAREWMPQNLTNEKSTLAQVMACCLMSQSYYLGQSLPRSMSLYGITTPHWNDYLFGETAEIIVILIPYGKSCTLGKKLPNYSTICALIDIISHNHYNYFSLQFQLFK